MVSDDYGFRRERLRPLRLMEDPIPVYQSNLLPSDVPASVERFLRQDVEPDESTLVDMDTDSDVAQWTPARSQEELRPAESTWHTPETIGVLETSWSFRTAATPPP